MCIKNMLCGLFLNTGSVVLLSYSREGRGEGEGDDEGEDGDSDCEV